MSCHSHVPNVLWKIYSTLAGGAGILTHMYLIHTCIYHTHMYLFIHTCISYTHVSIIHICIYSYTHVSIRHVPITCVFWHPGLCGMFFCAHTGLFCKSICTYAGIHPNMSLVISVYMPVCVCVRVCVCASSQTCVYLCVHACVCVCVRAERP